MRLALALLIASLAAAQSTQQFADLGDFRLVSGGTIPHCRIGYRTFGTLNGGRSNAVLVPTWFSGRSEDLAGLIGPGRLVDSSRFYVVAVDALADGVSSSPSNFPSAFPEVTIRDMVNSQHALLTGPLGINHLHAVVGISMGGMQTFEWVAAYPDFMDRAVPIIGSPKLTSADLLLWQAELSAIENVLKCRCEARGAMEAVNAIHQFALYTPEYRAEKTAPADFPAFKATLAESRMAPADWAAQLRAMMTQDIGRANGGSLERAAERVRAATLIVISRQDHMVNPAPARAFAAAIKARTIELTGNCGHMATACESERMTPAVSDFLSR
jgi:homoserine O-acetyltransferase